MAPVTYIAFLRRSLPTMSTPSSTQLNVPRPFIPLLRGFPLRATYQDQKYMEHG